MSVDDDARATIVRAFLIVISVTFAVLVLDLWQIEKTRHLVHENRILIASVNDNSVKLRQLRKAQTDSCTNYETLRAAVNDFHGTLRKFLTEALKAREVGATHIRTPALRAADRRAVRVYRELLGGIHLVTATCAQKRGSS